MEFENALKLDFQERLNLSVLMLSQHFELFGDRGETVWRNNIVVQDDSAPVKLVVWFKANIYHKIAGMNLDETNIRQAKYSGTDKNAAAVFKKLKAKQKDGYESLVPVKELFVPYADNRRRQALVQSASRKFNHTTYIYVSRTSDNPTR